MTDSFDEQATIWTWDALALLTAEITGRDANVDATEQIWESLDIYGRTYVGSWMTVLAARLIDDYAVAHGIEPAEYVRTLAEQMGSVT